MIYPILFLLILVIASGFIAYWGDLLGRRMGKRRLTLFGLRPKYTAIVVTTITGMVIAAAILTTMLIGSSELRKMILDSPQIIKKNVSLNKRNAALRKDIAGLQSKQADLQKRMEAAVEGAKHAEKKQQVAEQESKRFQVEVQQRATQLAAVKGVLEATATQLTIEKKNLTDTQEKRQAAERDFKKAREVAKRLLGRLGEFSSKAVIVESGEEIARAVVRPSAYARKDVTSLLDTASKIMKDKGAGIGKKNRRYVYLWPDADAEGDNVQAIVKKLVAGKDDVVVVVRAFLNTVKGEQVPVGVTLFNNRLAFRKGEVIASAIFEGSGSEARVMNRLLVDMQKAARKADMIPTFDSGSSQARYGAISLEELMSVATDISRVKSGAVVRVVARQDIKQGDRMDLSNMEFEIGKPSVRAANGD